MAVEPRLMTAEELLALPDDGMRRELVHGEVRTMAPAAGPHGWNAGRITLSLGAHIHANDLGEILVAETGFLLQRDPDTVRAPDFAFIRAEHWPSGGLSQGYVTIPPDLVVEAVSPGDTASEVREKVDEWLRFGVRAVWVLYPGPRMDVYLGDGRVQTYGPDDEVDGGEALPGFRMGLGTMLGTAKRAERRSG
jgi:Uma2 family endonuclease